MQFLNWVAQRSTTTYTVPSNNTTVDEGALGGLLAMMGVWIFFWLAVAVVSMIAMWKVFEKAGHPGWAAIVPIYNTYIMVQIAGRETWWMLLFFIPFANLVAAIIISIDIAKKFGKSEAFGIVALGLFSPVGYCMLGFGDAQYQGGSNKPTAQSGVNPNMTNTPQPPQAPTT